MKLRTIAFNNLRRRKSRLVFLLLGLLIGIGTVVTLSAMTSALQMEAQHQMETFGANILITPQVDELALSYGGVSLGGVSVNAQDIPEQDLKAIRTIPNSRNIAAVAPKVIGAVEVNGSRAMIMGVDQDIEFAMKKWWSVEGRIPANEKELVAGVAAAAALGLKEGDTIVLQGQPFTVSGILRETGSQDDGLLIVPLPAAQRLLGKEGKVNLVEVAALCADCPVEDIVGQLSDVLPDVKVSAIQQVIRTRMHALDQFRTFSMGVAGIVVLLGALAIFTSMMGSVKERTREIGIFRALGFRRSHVIGLVLLEAVWVSLAAGVLGWIGGMGITRLVLPLLTEGHPHLVWNPALAFGAVLLALVVGTSASLYPAFAASRLDPTEALRSL